MEGGGEDHKIAVEKVSLFCLLEVVLGRAHAGVQLPPLNAVDDGLRRRQLRVWIVHDHVYGTVLK